MCSFSQRADNVAVKTALVSLLKETKTLLAAGLRLPFLLCAKPGSIVAAS